MAEAHAMILVERTAWQEAEARAAEAIAVRRVLELEIERAKLMLARMSRERYGRSAERSAQIAQLELTLEDLEETAAGECQEYCVRGNRG